MDTAITDPIRDPTTPTTIIFRASLYLTCLFLVWIHNAQMEAGKKTLRFTLCAKCCGTPAKNIKAGIRMVPPPIPIPLTIPEAKPIRNNII
jgi:hypothetical protein